MSHSLFTNKIVIDIETENTGYDIMNDNKRILSIQLLDVDHEQIFYDGAQTNDLVQAQKTLNQLIIDKNTFVGFNIINFDIPLLKTFLNTEIHHAQISEITNLPMMSSIRERIGKNRPRLIEICDLLKIDCSHKNLMDSSAQKIKMNPDVQKMAKEGADKFSKELGWGYDFSLRLATDRIAGGTAILNSFNEFAQSNGDTASIFYKYAMGDVYTEKKLYEKMNAT